MYNTAAETAAKRMNLSTSANNQNAMALNRAQREAAERLRNPQFAVYEPKRAQTVRAASYGTMKSCPAAKRYTMWFGQDGSIQAHEIEEVM